MCNKMSEVRLSNASPTLERVDARQPDAARPSVCRNLFGSPDPEEIRRDGAASIQENVQWFKNTYNFDPVAERPLSPRIYDWQEDPDPPEFYTREPRRRIQRSPRGDVHDDRRDAEGSSSGRRVAPRDRGGSRKRSSGASGSCSSESMRKKSKDDNDDDDEEERGAAAQALEAAEERPSGPEESVQ
ncbi:cyclin-dependent kinase inhibitor 1B-like [Pungitius pungitius]|uniref:cyclin-dependent kinase inhibitor 1B-like n=1 Tax=Pungitius pungitius TaxID=134920 RepID=UPI002E14159A